MERIASVLLIAFLGLAIASAVIAKTRRSGPAINGVYGDFTVGAGSGDLEGMKVVLFTAHDEHYVLVQIAQGGAEDPAPEFVKANVKGAKVEFAVGSENYVGTVSAAGLRINGLLLKRKPCGDFFR